MPASTPEISFLSPPADIRQWVDEQLLAPAIPRRGGRAIYQPALARVMRRAAVALCLGGRGPKEELAPLATFVEADLAAALDFRGDDDFDDNRWNDLHDSNAAKAEARRSAR